MIKILGLGPIDNNAYIISNQKNALLVDAPAEGNKILDIIKANSLNLKFIFITHGHTDHIVSAEFLKEKTGAETIANEKDMDMFLKPWQFMKADPFRPDILVNDKEEIRLIGSKIIFLKVIHTPGHSQGSICLYHKKEKCVFTGDTLFNGTIGRTDFAGGNYRQLIKNIKEKLFALPEETKVFPGHGRHSTIKYEMENFRFS